MRYKQLGTTGLFVSEFCLGTMTFGTPAPQYAAAGGMSQDALDDIALRAFDAGINFIDTANVYSAGEAEEMVGRMLRTHRIARQDVIISTKVDHAIGAGPNDAGASRHHITYQVRESLRRLDTDYIDLYQLHGWDPVTPIEETLRALDDMVRQGFVRYVGVSNWAAWQVIHALGLSDRLSLARFKSYQGYYSLVGRDVEREVMPMLHFQGLGFLAFSPLAGGYLTGKYRNGRSEGRRASIPFPPVDEGRGGAVLSAMDVVAAVHETSLEAIALAWLCQQPGVTSVILGLKSIEQLEANLAAADIDLSWDELASLNAAGGLPVEYPGWMIANDQAARQALVNTGKLQEAWKVRQKTS